LRDVSNRGDGAHNQNGASAGKRPRTQKKQVIVLADDDETMHEARKPRRSSLRLIAKREKEEKAERQAERQKKKTERSEKVRVKRKRTSVARSEPPAKKMRTASDASKVTMRQINRLAKSRIITKISGEDQYLVHPDFRLQRESFNGKNHTLGIAKHDKDDVENELMNAPYTTDMFQHLFAAETITMPKTYMSTQNDINSKMRAILIDWLVEVHMKFRLVPETLYLCVNIIDRYCGLVQVKRSKLQLVGVTALLIACKYEEIYPPEVRDCVYITDRAYQSNEVLGMEQDIVHKLGFKITVPTAFPFLQRFFTMVKASKLVQHASSYYTERTLQEHDMLKYRPSVICASAVILALNHPQYAMEDGRSLNKKRIFMPPILLEYTQFDEKLLIECARDIAKKVAEEPVTASRRELTSVKKKYDNRKYLDVSTEYDLPKLPRHR